MPNTPFTGKKVVVTWTQTVLPDGTDVVSPAAVTLSTYGRNFGTDEKGDTVETTTYAEAQTGYRAHLPILADATASMDVMAQQGDWDLYDALAPGSLGTLIVYPEGNTTGERKETYAKTSVTKRSRPMPYDDVVKLSIEFQLSGAPTIGTAT